MLGFALPRAAWVMTSFSIMASCSSGFEQGSSQRNPVRNAIQCSDDCNACTFTQAAQSHRQQEMCTARGKAHNRSRAQLETGADHADVCSVQDLGTVLE